MRINRRDFCKFGAGSAALSAMPEYASGGTRTNVIVIYADDLDFRHLGYYGSLLTPNIDSLASDGTVLNNYHATSSVCTPSRFSLLTGQYPTRSKALLRQFPLGGPATLEWNTGLRTNERIVARAFQDAGYVTGMVGKWHLGHGGNAHTIANDADPDSADVRAKLERNYEAAQSYIGNKFGFDSVESLYVRNVSGIQQPDMFKFHNQDWITEGAVSFIANNRGAPFFLYMATTLPHGPHPFTASIDADPRITPRRRLSAPPLVQAARESIAPRVAAAGLTGGYAHGMLWLDDGIGAILEALASYGIYDNTAIVLASDHQIRGKFTCYEGCHAPCFVKWPATMAGPRVLDELIANIDITPTLLDLCGIAQPPDMPFDGASFLPLAADDSVAWRDALLLTMGYSRAVVTADRWKYLAIRYPEGVAEGEPLDYDITGRRRAPQYGAAKHFPRYHDADQLYDLDADPREQNNIVDQAALAARLNQLKAQLSALLQPLGHSFGEFTESKRPAEDRIASLDAPLSLRAGATVPVTVNLGLTGRRDVLLALSAVNGSWWGGRLVQRNVAANSTVMAFDFPVPETLPPGVELRWIARILPLGRDWPDTITAKVVAGVFAQSVAEDAILSVTAPTRVPETGAVNVDISATLSEPRDILLALRARTSSWWGGRVIKVNVAPDETPVQMVFPIRNDPPRNTDLEWIVRVLPRGTDWPETVIMARVQGVQVGM